MGNCSNCGKPITAGSYCNNNCQRLRNKRRRQLYNSKKRKKKCLVCFRTIVNPASNAQIYCSDVCMRTARADSRNY
jgi:predicted nucleic acid-binding Zn ribbon protein